MSLGTNIWNIETISALSLFHSWKRHMFSLCPCLEILFPWHLSSFLSFTAYSILSTLKKKELIKYLFYKAFWFYPPTSFSTFNNVDVAWWNLPSSFHIILLLLFFILTSHLFVNVTYLLCSYSKLATMTRTTVNMSTRQTGLLASQSFTFSAGGKQRTYVLKTVAQFAIIQPCEWVGKKLSIAPSLDGGIFLCKSHCFCNECFDLKYVMNQKFSHNSMIY